VWTSLTLGTFTVMVTNASLQSRCLIIEDQALIAMSVEAYLEDVGFAVQTVTSITQGREWLKDNTPEFVILDFMLKDGPATELAGELHRRGIPFIVYSGTRGILVCPLNFKRCPGSKNQRAVRTC
jgi:DNA-binding NtrC family response regulator